MMKYLGNFVHGVNGWIDDRFLANSIDRYFCETLYNLTTSSGIGKCGF